MNIIEGRTDNLLSPLPLNNVLNAIPQANKSYSNKMVAFSTMALALTFSQNLDIADYKKSFPTNRPAYEPIQSFNTITESKKSFTFSNSSEVLKYIEERPAVSNLYKSLNGLIASAFGNVDVHLSIFKEYEENWSNLLVEIKSDYGIDELLKLEDKLFAIIEKDKSHLAAMKYVTISCG